MRDRFVGVLAVLALALAASTSALAAGPKYPFASVDNVFADTLKGAPLSLAQHHGGPGGHLPGTQANVDLVAKLRVSNVRPGWVADVATYRDTAFLAGWAPMCSEAANQRGGFWSISIRNPRQPQEVAFVPAPADTYLTEGMHALRLTTPTFTGDVLAVSNELCTAAGQGGMSLYDVTNPAAPVPLVIGAGDTDDTAPRAHSSHSIFAWDTGPKAYAVLADNEDFTDGDVDIFDITDPRNPLKIRETGLDDWPEAQDNLAFGEQTFIHDVVVRRAEGKWLMLISYWDAGYVILDVTNPAAPVYLRDSDFPATDGLGLTNNQPQEGNAHEAEFDRCPEEGVRSRFPCGDVRYVLVADEDFSTHRTGRLSITTGPNAGQSYETVPVGGGAAPAILPDRRLNGPVVYGGYGCPDPDGPGGAPGSAPIPPASSGPPLAAGEERIVVLQRGPTGDPSAPEGACFPGEKADMAVAAGYQAVLFVNRHGVPDSPPFCGSGGGTGGVVSACTTHTAFHRIFNTTPDATVPYPPEPNNEPDIGAVGSKIDVSALFDGWGYMRLLDYDTMQELDAYAVPEALDERFSTGFGDLSIHEITTDPTGDVGYAAWYSAGFRVVDYSGGNLKEVGRYIDPEGSDIWGVELNVRRDGRLFAFASDRNYGLYIFRFGTDLQVSSSNARGRVGRVMTIRSTVRNDGTIDETNAQWKVRLPRGVHAMGVLPSQGRCSVRGRLVTCNLGRVVENGRAGIVLRVMAERAGTTRPLTQVAGRKAEYDIGNNSDRSVLRVRAASGAAGAGAGGALTGRN
jgi:hypothetical protein